LSFPYEGRASRKLHSPQSSQDRLRTTSVTENDAKTTTKHSEFNYEKFYAGELDKKHNDSSYRYFNNINRLAAKFPVAHTAKVTDEVEVWCANDYLGMGNNPVVLETIQYVRSCFRCIRDTDAVSSV
jgi:5-aminolevulinate synthase